MDTYENKRNKLYFDHIPLAESLHFVTYRTELLVQHIFYKGIEGLKPSSSCASINCSTERG